MKIKVILVFAIVHAVVQCVSDRLQLFTPSVAAIVRRLDLVVLCQPNFLMMAFSCGLYGMLIILEACHLFLGYFKCSSSANATCSHDVGHLRLGGKEVQEGGKREISDEHPVLPSVSSCRPHSPSTTPALQ